MTDKIGCTDKLTCSDKIDTDKIGCTDKVEMLYNITYLVENEPKNLENIESNIKK